MQYKFSRGLASALLVAVLSTSFSPAVSAMDYQSEESAAFVQSMPVGMELSAELTNLKLSADDEETLLAEAEDVGTEAVEEDSPEVEPVAAEDSSAKKVSTLSNMSPSEPFALESADKVLISCVAPSGAKVSAKVNGKTVKMTQKTKAAKGTAVKFQGTFTAPKVTKNTKDLGEVTYTMTFGNKTVTKKSAGNLYVVGSKIEGGKFVVQVVNFSASIFDNSKREHIIGIARQGAVDYVVGSSSKDYHLASGGWIQKDTVKPVSKSVVVKNKVSKSSFKKTSDGESLSLTGTSHPMYRSSRSSKKLTITLLNTTGVKKPTVSGSSLFSGVSVSEKNGATTLTFSLSGKRKLWGYDISYKNGVTNIYAKYKPQVGSSGKPLDNALIVIDPGHGGDDPGAIGVARSNGGAVESEINYAAALTTKKRLEKLGAEVVFTRNGDESVSLNERLAVTRKENPDLFLAIHSNSGGTTNGASGVETYYYDDISDKFATALAKNLAENTGRVNRGARASRYRMTLHSLCPAVLLEMGFVSNLKEYNELLSKESMAQTAEAIADAAITAFK